MSEHHNFSPSSLERLDLCSGSYEMNKLVDKSTIQESEYATDGKLKHKIVEMWERRKEIDGLSQEHIDCAERCIEIMLLTASLDKWEREVRIETMGRDFEVLNYGTVDAVYESDDFVYAWDWKFGRSNVKDVCDNLQAINYVVGLIQKYDKPVIFGIYQEPLNRQDTFTFNDDIIEQFYDRYYSIKTKCLDTSKLVLTPNVQYCSYCDAMGICPMSKTVLNNTELAKIEHTSELSHDVLYDYYTKWKIIEKIGNNLKNTIKFKLQKGEELDGFGLRNSSGNKFINDPQGAFDAINDNISVQELMSCTNLKITKLEEIFINNYIENSTEKITKKGAKAEFYIRLEDFIGRGKDKVSLVQKSKN